MKLTYIIWILSIIAIVKPNKGNQLSNDICALVNVTSPSTAQIECDIDTKKFDPTDQDGMYLFDQITSSWNKSAIFSCLCNCHLTEIKNGHILTVRIGHRETLEYECNEGFHKTDKRKVICLDGLLVLLPDNLKDYNISIAFRLKALHRSLINKLQGIFALHVSETSRWTISETEVCNNQKYFQSLSNDETKLELYLFDGVGYTIGTVDLLTRLEPACIKTESVLSAGAIAGVITVPVLTVLLIVVIVVYCLLKRSSGPTTEPNEQHRMLI